MENHTLRSVDDVEAALKQHDYIADRGLATTVYLALKLNKPVFLEGEAGVGKTEIAKVLAVILDTRLIRLQCYEGLDVNTAVYEWNYTRQMLQIRMLEARGDGRADAQHEIFAPEFLIRRPLLQAIEDKLPQAPVLLIDEIDRSDEEFEAYLLELLSDWQITIPELGTVKASRPPVTIITSNRTREVHDALKRRCLYYWIDYPSFEKEYRIVLLKVPGMEERLARQVVNFVQELRRFDLYKLPGVAETLDWSAALVALDQKELSESAIGDTLGALLKYQDDVTLVHGNVARELLQRVRQP
ncbi:MAG: MoxR family ATPase [Chloroflexi bacterium]|nr:MoxR family ATPase [Chloroflexota bacterium]